MSADPKLSIHPSTIPCFYLFIYFCSYLAFKEWYRHTWIIISKSVDSCVRNNGFAHSVIHCLGHYWLRNLVGERKIGERGVLDSIPEILELETLLPSLFPPTPSFPPFLSSCLFNIKQNTLFCSLHFSNLFFFFFQIKHVFPSCLVF